MNRPFDFNDIFVFDLANNHQGSVDHALSIISQIGEVVRNNKVRGVFKFQFRQLESFVHHSHKEKSDNKHIPRFLATKLERSDFQILLDQVRAEGMLSMCTPFDEESVDVIADMGFDLIKVASCSAKDWPLLEKISESNLPLVFSTGGLQLNHIDDLVSFFEHQGSEFGIMHCVSVYPTPLNMCHLNQIEVLRSRYRNRVVGWSTHENPSEMAPIQIAYAKGARMFERHVGIPTEQSKLNDYSSTPEDVNKWINSWKIAVELCGSKARQISEIEQESLNSLRRGVYARGPIKKGETLERENVYFAMPYIDGQLDSGNWKSDITVISDLSVDEPLLMNNLNVPRNPDYQIIKNAVHEVKALLNEANIVLNSEFEVEYSHHYGISEFRQFGAVIINCINREYCKKILVQLPGQKHPMHFHPLKEETFQLLYGTLNIDVDGHVRSLGPGETCLVLPGVWHSFWTETGCVLEEVSTTHFNSDSVYKDAEINKKQRHERKTVVDHWGRFQLPIKVKIS
jgi:sialic acid synthase SpsE/D-lyxose ketol-isomerase